MQRLRELHAAMDRAALEVYGRQDLAAHFSRRDERGRPRLSRLPVRPSDFRDEVSAHLFELNAARHDEVRRGIAPAMKGVKDIEDDVED